MNPGTIVVCFFLVLTFLAWLNQKLYVTEFGRKVRSWKQLRVGGVYSRVYVGPNEAYARVNGKETFRVLKTKPSLEVQILFEQFGSLFSNEITSDIVTFSSPEKAFEEFEIFEPYTESQWFVKSTMVTTIEEGINRGLLLIDEVRDRTFTSREFTVYWWGEKLSSRPSLSFSREGISGNQYFQRTFVLWDSWEAARAELGCHGSSIEW